MGKTKRIQLHELLCEILGTKHAYFQPTVSVKMVYPAIVYSRKSIDNTFANNSVYRQDDSYEVTVIDKNPDSEIVRKISQLPMCRFDRHFTSENLNHDVFTLYV